MNKYPSAIERRHRPAKSPEVSFSRSLEIHRDVDVRHPKTGHDAAFVRQRVIGSRKREIDHRLETRLANLTKLLLGGLAGRSQALVNRAKVVNLGQRPRH